ncbi:MAG: hypothetical protein ACOYMA_03060 [Bacteroidia bacterium]
MKSIITLLITFSLLSAKVFGQASWIEPENPDVTKPIRIYVDLTKTTNTSCSDSTGPFYIWTWNPKEHPIGHPLVNGSGEKSWQNSNDALKMKNDATKGPLVWYYEMTPTEFYEVPASDVYKKGISLLVKTKNGGGYGDPDVKTEDLIFTIEPPKTDRGSMYASPSDMVQNEVVNLIYDNTKELNPVMKNLVNEELYMWVNASIKDTVTGIIRTFAPSTFLNINQNQDLRLVYDGSGKYRLSMIPNKIFNITSPNDLITQVELVVYMKSITDRSDGQPKIKFSCQ